MLFSNQSVIPHSEATLPFHNFSVSLFMSQLYCTPVGCDRVSGSA